MQVLSFGYKQPETGDRGSVWFPALNFDVQRLNDHNHDGTNSTKLTGAAITGLTGPTILAAGWVAVAGQAGTYSQDVNMPAGTLYDDYVPTFRIFGGGSAGKLLALTVNKLAGAQYRIFINDNTLDLSVLYLV